MAERTERIIAVAGPTASGKTALAAELALRLGGEVVSNDSMQVYADMEIGTAAPGEEEKRGVPHHLIGICTPERDFSCAEYGELAKQTVSEIQKRGRTPIFCGGTGLYLDAAIKVGEYSPTVKDTALRARLEAFAQSEGALALHDRLRRIDPQSAETVHPNNVRRVIRAIEIYEATGVPKSEWDRRSVAAAPRSEADIIVLEFESRELLYSRIDARVDKMVAAGLVAEAEALWKKGLLGGKYPAAQAIGYKELVPYFEGRETLDSACAQIKQNTRRYAKRQITWFKRYGNRITVHPDCNGEMRDTAELCSEVLERLCEK